MQRKRTTTSWLDPLFNGISNLFINGVQTVKERGLNLIPGTGVTITYADNAAAARTDVTITSTGGGGGAVPTGTGFYAVVAGAMQAAARAVNLASSDITGILAAANQAAQTMGGDSTGTTAANQVQALSIATAIPVTGPGFAGLSTTGATGQNIGLTSGASTATNGTPGNILANIPLPTGTGGEGYLTVTRGGSTIVQIGACQGASSFDAIYFGGVTPSTNNYAFLGSASATYLNGTSSVNFQVNGALQAQLTTNVFNMLAPALAWSGTTTAPTISQQSTATGNGQPFVFSGQTTTAASSTGGKVQITPGQGTTKGGDAEVHLYTPTAGTEPYFKVFRNLAGTDTAIAAIGHWPSALAYGTCLWLGQGNAPSPTTTNWSLYDYAGSTAVNGSSGVSLQFNNVALWTLANSTSITCNAPVTGDSTQSSPYGVHGDVTAAFTATTTLTAAQYSQEIIVASPTAAMSLNGFPRAAATAGYTKLIVVTAAFAVTVSDGTHSVVLPAAIGKYVVAFTNAAVY